MREADHPRDWAVLFDFDGTLFYGTARLNAWCFEQVLGQMGKAPPTRDKLDRSVGMPFGDIARLMLDSSDPREIALFTRLVFERVPEYIRRFVRPDPQVLAMLASLRPRARLAVCSNAAESYLYPMLEALAIAPLLDAVWPFRQGYPKAAAIPELMGQLGVERALFVGDRLEDVLSAREAGVPVVGIRNGAFPREVDAADAVVESTAQMHRAIQGFLGGP